VPSLKVFYAAGFCSSASIALSPVLLVATKCVLGAGTSILCFPSLEGKHHCDCHVGMEVYLFFSESCQIHSLKCFKPPETFWLLVSIAVTPRPSEEIPTP
jgi:hypothetical protein